MRGRPKGATSLVRVRLSDLLAHLTPAASIIVGRQWLADIGLDIAPAEMVAIPAEKIESVEPKAEIQLTTFEGENN